MSLSSDPPEFSSLPESLQFLQLIWALNAALERTSDGMEARLGVTGRQRFILRLVGLMPGVTTDQLATALTVDAEALDGDLERLKSKALVATGGDGSQRSYFLTAKGATVNASTLGTVESAVSKALDEATPYERAAFRRMIERMSRLLAADFDRSHID